MLKSLWSFQIDSIVFIRCVVWNYLPTDKESIMFFTIKKGVDADGRDAVFIDFNIWGCITAVWALIIIAGIIGIVLVK